MTDDVHKLMEIEETAASLHRQLKAASTNTMTDRLCIYQAEAIRNRFTNLTRERLDDMKLESIEHWYSTDIGSEYNVA